MTLAELTEEVMETIALHPRADRIGRGEVVRLLNRAMHEISLTLGIPTVYVTVPREGMIDGPFSLPTNVHPEGIRYAEVVEAGETDTAPVETLRNREVPLVSIGEAHEFHPGWENDEDAVYTGAPFITWSPADPGRGLEPVGIRSASYRFLVHAVPEPMKEDGDEPFAVVECYDNGYEQRRPGAMPAYHRVLSHFVNHELLQRLGDERWQAYFARYEQMRQEMFAQVAPAKVHLPTWSGGRRPRYRV